MRLRSPLLRKIDVMRAKWSNSLAAAHQLSRSRQGGMVPCTQCSEPLYLGNTLYRIHGTNQPSTIGQFVSSGCIPLINEDIEDLYNRVTLGTRVVVLPGGHTLRSQSTLQ